MYREIINTFKTGKKGTHIFRLMTGAFFLSGSVTDGRIPSKIKIFLPVHLLHSYMQQNHVSVACQTSVDACTGWILSYHAAGCQEAKSIFLLSQKKA